MIHGGLDANGYSIDDFVAFSLTNESVKEIKWFPFGLGKLSGHTFVSISNDLKVQFPIFEEYDENADINKKLKITSNEGIYSFGGIIAFQILINKRYNFLKYIFRTNYENLKTLKN